MDSYTTSPLPVGSKIQDLTGNRYERLVVIGFNSSANYLTKWVCECDCGNFSLVDGGNLRSGKQVSCGCLRKEKATTHGFTNHPLWKTYKMMMARCYNPKTNGFDCYGGRGIHVCKRWRESFTNFTHDMGPKPSPSLTLERKDNSGNYTPDNCKWATTTEQGANRRNNRILELKGERLTATQWGKRLGIPINNIAARIRLGWDDEKILTTPIKPNPHYKSKS